MRWVHAVMIVVLRTKSVATIWRMSVINSIGVGYGDLNTLAIWIMSECLSSSANPQNACEQVNNIDVQRGGTSDGVINGLGDAVGAAPCHLRTRPQYDNRVRLRTQRCCTEFSNESLSPEDPEPLISRQAAHKNRMMQSEARPAAFPNNGAVERPMRSRTQQSLEC